jgi:hypothetical protein
MSINDHIKRNKEILDDPQVSSQTRRHIQTELEQLERYKENHPDDDYDPTSLELFCEENPDSLECRIYND